MVAGSAGLIVGMFLGMAIAKRKADPTQKSSLILPASSEKSRVPWAALAPLKGNGTVSRCLTHP